MKDSLILFLFSLLLHFSSQQFFRIPGKATRVKPSKKVDASESVGEEQVKIFLEDVHTLTNEKPTYHKIPNVKPRLFGRISKPDPALGGSSSFQEERISKPDPIVGHSIFQEQRISKGSSVKSKVIKLPQPISKKANPNHVQHLTHTDPELSNLFVKVAKPIVADNEAPIHAKIHSKATGGRSHLLKRLPKPIVKTIAPVAEPLQDDAPILNEIFDKVSAPADVESESRIHTIHGRTGNALDQRRGSILSGSSNNLRRLPRPVTRKAHLPAAEPLENKDPELTDIFMKVAKPVVAEVTSPRVDQSSGSLRFSSASSLATKTSSYSKISKPTTRNVPSSNTQAATVRATTYHSAPSVEASAQVQRRVNKPRVANFQLFQSANRRKTPSLVIQDQHVGFEDDTSVIPTCPDNKYTYIIPHSEQCDAYYTCEEGNIKLELCPDGLVFSIEAVKCVEIQYEKCEGRPALQPPQGVAPCDRENGVFNPNDSCDGFVTCRDNVPVHGKCAPGLVFNPEEKVCAWADEVLRADCLPSDLLGFICPNPVLPIEVARTENIQLRFGDHDRHADVNDCRYFFTCLTTGHPRRAGCGGGKVFDIATGACTAPEGVEGCEEYYKTVGSKATKVSSYRFKGLLAHVNQG